MAPPRSKCWIRGLTCLRRPAAPKVYTEVISSARAEHPIFAQLFKTLCTGDVLVIWKLECLAHDRHRSNDLSDGLTESQRPDLHRRAQGRLIFNLFAFVAAFERKFARERTQVGLSAAQTRGRLGVPEDVCRKGEGMAYTPEALYRKGRPSAQESADKLHISKSTLYA